MFPNGLFPQGYFPPGYWPRPELGEFVAGRGFRGAGVHRAYIMAMLQQMMDEENRDSSVKRAKQKIAERVLQRKVEFVQEQEHHRKTAERAAYTVLLAEL